MDLRSNIHTYIDHLGLLEPISGHKTRQSEQNGKPVLLLEILWQYYVHRGDKQELLVNKSHQNEFKWLYHAK